MPDKYEKEIEDILEGLGEGSSNSSSQGQNRPVPEAKPFVARLPKRSYLKSPQPITPLKLVIVGIIAFILGLWFRPLIWVSLGVFALAYLLVFRRSGSSAGKNEKKWRGKVIEEKKSGMDKLKDWLRRYNT